MVELSKLVELPVVELTSADFNFVQSCRECNLVPFTFVEDYKK